MKHIFKIGIIAFLMMGITVELDAMKRKYPEDWKRHSLWFLAPHNEAVSVTPSKAFYNADELFHIYSIYYQLIEGKGDSARNPILLPTAQATALLSVADPTMRSLRELSFLTEWKGRQVADLNQCLYLDELYDIAERYHDDEIREKIQWFHEAQQKAYQAYKTKPTRIK